SRTNASRTAREYASSSVKRVRLQSHEQPITLSCSRMVSPVSRMNAHTRSTNCSRPRSNRVFPSLATSRSTTFRVAIPAASGPGSHSASRPRIRSKRINTSWITLLRPCPVWRIAVMLGGGMTITYGSRDESERAVNTPRSCQRRYSGASTSCGSYCGGSSNLGCGIPYNKVEYSPMADELNVLPTSRIVRWVAIGASLVFSLALYFRDRRTLPPLTAPTSSTASPTAPPDQPLTRIDHGPGTQSCAPG